MQFKKPLVVAALAAAAAAAAFPAVAQDQLTGDTRLACEAVLCLSSGTRPSECSPSLSRYFGINKRKLNDTLRARLNFLELCPVSSQTPEMQSLVAAISRGAGRCDAESLNATNLVYMSPGNGGGSYISNRMPSYCTAYTGHAYTDFESGGYLPKYVGQPQEGGYWVEAGDYDRALAEYNAQHPQPEPGRGGWWGGN